VVNGAYKTNELLQVLTYKLRYMHIVATPALEEHNHTHSNLVSLCCQLRAESARRRLGKNVVWTELRGSRPP